MVEQTVVEVVEQTVELQVGCRRETDCGGCGEQQMRGILCILGGVPR